ncbi:DUF4145 domain-containing protein, partial [Xanthomonas oryzae]
MTVDSNFSFLQEHDPVFFKLASMAEQVFASDPNTTLIKLRQFAEALAQDLAGRAGILHDQRTTQADLIYQLARELRLDRRIQELFHVLRVEGNKATHGFTTQHREAMDGLKVARDLAVWYHRAFGRNAADFKAGAFVPPKDPAAPLRDVQAEVHRLKAELDTARQQHDQSQALAELKSSEAKLNAELAEAMDIEARAQSALAVQREQELHRLRQDFEQRIASLQQPDTARQAATQQVADATQQASNTFDLSEDLTRILIDQQLREAGWEADSLDLTHAKGTRPEKGRNLAIAEWPTKVPRANADYVLFAGLTPVAVVEAKRKQINIADRIPQAERYARDFAMRGELAPAYP